MSNKEKKMMLDYINDKYQLSKKDIGELETYQCSGMTFHNSSYCAKGLGNVSLCHAVSGNNMMKMDSLIINPFEIDAPLISIDVVEAFGTYKVYGEIYDTTLNEKIDVGEFEKVVNLYNEYVDEPAKENWYDYLIIKTIRKVGKIGDEKISNLKFDILNAYLKTIKNCPNCDINQKKAKAKIYSDGLLEHGGPATDPVKATLGIEKTRDLFNKVTFGVE